MAFHEVLFPIECSSRMHGGPERRTDIVTTDAGYEERNQRWANSRRRWNAGYGITSYAQLQTIVAFFEERRGRFHGFRVLDRLDFTSASSGVTVTPTDQVIGTGDDETTAFQLKKTYGASYDPWSRDIKKPVSGTIRVAVNGSEQTLGADFTVDATTGIVTFDTAPGDGLSVTAGFQFHVPSRFDADMLDVDLGAVAQGTFVDIPIIELKL